MKIKSDFVTNSSSTSFVLISAEDLSKESFLGLLGVSPTSPWLPFFESLFNAVQRKMYHGKEFVERYHEASEEWIDVLAELFPDEVVRRIKRGTEEGKNVFVGRLSSDDGDPIEAFFAVESFEIEDERVYFNALECAW